MHFLFDHFKIKIYFVCQSYNLGQFCSQSGFFILKRKAHLTD